MSERQVITAFDGLFERLSGHLSAYPYPARRWQEIGNGQSTMVEVRNPAAAIGIALALADRKIGGWPEYQRAKAACEQDVVFKDAPRLAGYWGTFDRVFATTATPAATVRKGKIIFNRAKGRAKIRELRKHFESSSFRYECRTRILGADLTQKKVFLPDGVELYRLNREERNARQPIVEPFATMGATGWGLVPKVEARYHLTVPIDRHADNAFFVASNEALQSAMAVFARVVDALTAAHTGRFDHGPIELLGGFAQGGQAWRDTNLLFSHRLSAAVCHRASVFYDLLRNPGYDRVINRALRRLVLGRKRTDPIDRLVDLVVGWEAIVLTQDGKSLRQELTYRFAVNSALIVSRATRRRVRPSLLKQFRAAYAARSSIVHGDNDAALGKALRAGGFGSASAGCDFLETHLRQVILWLNGSSTNSRPYRLKGGWDRLLWR